MKDYTGFGDKLHHEIPAWVDSDNLFHIRIRSNGTLLTESTLAPLLLKSIKFYEQRERWRPVLVVLMPDHLHAIIALGFGETLSKLVADWKRYHAKANGVCWQENFFDHRLREDERGEHLEGTLDYLRQNPVAAGLCAHSNDWPWIYPPNP